jgi:hypothetical protein
MDNTRIIELFIDDEYQEAGIEAISLVSKPAHDEEWMAFNSQKQDDGTEEFSPYTIAEENFCDNHPKLDQLGESSSIMEQEGWEIVKMEKITPSMVQKMSQERFTKSNPNAESQLDTDDIRVRFKYIGPRDDSNRKFCADMMSKNRVYRIEDIEQLSNPEFGAYNIFLFRGSYNCRHAWVRLFYKKEGKIRNSGLSNTNKLELEDEIVIGPDTRNQKTIDNPGPNTWEPGVARTGAELRGSFNTTELNKKPFKPNRFDKEEGLEGACWEGYEPIGLKDDGSPNCVPIKMTQDDFVDSISDYPEGVKNAAKRAVDYAEENGWGSCGTQVGKTRASQLAKGEPISVDTLKRMYSYLSRHKVDLQSSKTYEDGCGKLMFDSWGGEAGLTYSERKLKQLEKEKMSFSKTHMMFGFDEDKKIVVGAAMVPNKMIHRYDELGNLYYVFFSASSIKKMADRFMQQGRTDETSIEHDGKKLGSDKVYIAESWVSDDPIYDKSHQYGFSLPKGTWFVSMKVEDEKVWKMIKDKSLTGFSVEGLFAEKSIFSKEDKKINQIRKILKSITDEQ